MKKPRMILFDYGQTLVNEVKFDGVRGTKAVLTYATENKYGLTAEQVQKEADAINRELGRFDPTTRHLFTTEVPNHMFTAYLYESLGIKLSLSAEETDRVFWDAASPGQPTEGIGDFLRFLKENEIRTGVISNISYSGNVVKERIADLIPDNNFEFIIATSEYIFRKPHGRIFNLALEKAGLKAEDVWYVGDNYECDVAGSRNAGMFPVWYIGATYTHDGSNDDVLTVRNWEELKQEIIKLF